MAACKSAEQEKLLGPIFNTSRLTYLAGALKVRHLKGGYNHTGSFPSIASIHSRLLASDRACRVMTPCLQETDRDGEQRSADVSPEVSTCPSAVFLSHLSTTSMSKQKRLSIESLFLLTQERSLNISGVPFTTPFCRQGGYFSKTG